MATYSCDNGFSLVGNSNRTCTGDGSSIIGAFDGVDSTCEGIKTMYTYFCFVHTHKIAVANS